MANEEKAAAEIQSIPNTPETEARTVRTQPEPIAKPAEPITPVADLFSPEIASNLSNFSPTFGKLAGAMARAQAGMKQPEKTKTARIKFKNNSGGEGREKTYKYCDIADILKVALPALGEQSLAWFQFPIKPRSQSFTIYDNQNNPIEITRLVAGVRTVIVHDSGEWVENIIEATGEGMAPQALASVLTYLRRLGGQMLLGIAGDADDDGEAGQGEQEGGASGVEGNSVPTGPRSTNGKGVLPDGEHIITGTVQDAEIKPVGANKTPKYSVLISNYGWVGTLNEKIGKTITRENGSGLIFDFKVKISGGFKDVLSAEPAKAKT